MSKVVIGLSGGVDSAVAASLLRGGYELTGVWLNTGSGTPDAACEAAKSLDIPLIIRDVREAFEREVVCPFEQEYLSGRTPNPCVICNRRVKLKTLFDAADELGAEYVATGHYARRTEYHGEAAIAQSVAKDQSYMLMYIDPAWQSRLLFPLGEAASKDAVRAAAREQGLSAADAPDSQDICFIPDGDHGAFMAGRGHALPPGEIVDETGKILGKHNGLHRYTVGQRRGLGVAAGERVYVSALDTVHNRVVLSHGDALLTDTVQAVTLNFLHTPPLPGTHLSAKLRLGAKPAGCTVEEIDLSGSGRMILRFDEPLRMAAPGQSAVLYDGGVLLGGGFITDNPQ